MTDRRYSQRDIERIIYSGSVKQKARLYIRDRMGYFGQGFILTYSDIEALTLSILTYQRPEWEEYIGAGLRLENGFKDMNRSLERLSRDRENLRRTLIEIQDFERLEVIINRLLSPRSFEDWERVGEWDFPIPDEAQQNLAERRFPTEGFNLIKPTIDSESHVDLNLSGPGGLRDRANIEQNLLREEMTFYLCFEVAIRRRIEGLMKLDIPEYEGLLRENREKVELPLSLCLRWEGVQDNRLSQVGEANLKDRKPREYPLPSLRDLIEDYSVRPTDIDLNSEDNLNKINEIFLKI